MPRFPLMPDQMKQRPLVLLIKWRVLQVVPLPGKNSQLVPELQANPVKFLLLVTNDLHFPVAASSDELMSDRNI